MRKLKLLAITNIPPLPILDGVSLRVYNLLENLPDIWEIDIICKNPKEGLARKQIIDKFNNVYFVEGNGEYYQNKIKNINKFIYLIFPPKEIYSLNVPFNNELNEYVKKNILAKNYDAILCFGAANYGFYLSSFEKLNITCDVCDSVALNIKSAIKIKRPFSKEYLSYYYAYLYNLRWEKNYLNRCKKIIIISERDKKWLSKSIDKSKIYVISNGVDTDYYNPYFVNPGKEKLVIFTGVMDYEPNHDAMVHCLKEIWPRIKEKEKEAKLKIVGRLPRKELIELARKQKDVEVTGEVDDIRKEIRGAKIFLCSMRIGSGLKNKILESLAMGIPIISTSEGIEGIEFENRKVGYIADNPIKIADLVARLLNNDEEWNFLSLNSRKLVKEKYSWKSKGEELSEILLKPILM